MSAPIYDLLGLRFGKLVVLSLAGRAPVRWNCRCDCGSLAVIASDRLRGGLRKSCGCIQGARGLSLQEKIDFFSTPEPNSGCWLWFGALNTKGYGLVNVGGRSRLAHRISYQAFRGAPSKPTLDHVCRTKNCVNPDHLEPVTFSENSIRGQVSRNGHRDMCRRGHFGFYRIYAHGRRGTTRMCSECCKVSSRLYAKRVAERMEAIK